ncbi:hypothetical protein F5Y18DRAFT_437556 [Xylariaceae sp. FL1019]|nr:hypothetical protein F5Y18DRAFT_437556 [Xylariaceae sp. FL1019]
MRDSVAMPFGDGRRLHLLLPGFACITGAIYANIRYQSCAGTVPFLTIALFRYVRVIGNVVGWLSYEPAVADPNADIIRPENVAVLMQTVGDMQDQFRQCVRCMVYQRPRVLVICTTETHLDRLRQAIREMNLNNSGVPIHCIAVGEANRRLQLVHSLETPLPSSTGQSNGVSVLSDSNVRAIVMSDDHVFPQKGFLEFALAPLNVKNSKASVVNTGKRVRRRHSASWSDDFLNYLAAVYLERHNTECAATSRIDGGHFVVSGRCLIMRKSLWEEEDVRHNYLNEHWGGSAEVLLPDDDAWIGRHCHNIGQEVAFQIDCNNLLETDLGDQGWAKLQGQMLRWGRTWFRTGFTALWHDRVWARKPWTAYAVHLSGMLNFALPLDLLLLWNWWHAAAWIHRLGPYLLLFWFLSKVFEPLGHWRREPRDLIYLVPGILFGWYHSLVKVIALCTVYDVGWTGRKLEMEKKTE